MFCIKFYRLYSLITLFNDVKIAFGHWVFHEFRVTITFFPQTKSDVIRTQTLL